MPYPGWSQPDVDQYTAIVSSVKSDPKYKDYSQDRVQKLAASIVNKRRSKAGRTLAQTGEKASAASKRVPTDE